MGEVKYINIKEFREQGYLQEANRQFFHPLGLALEIKFDEEGNEYLGGVWDYRDDPEGMLYGDSIVSSKKAKENQKRISGLMKEKLDYRWENLGYSIQPIGSGETVILD